MLLAACAGPAPAETSLAAPTVEAAEDSPTPSPTADPADVAQTTPPLQSQIDGPAAEPPVATMAALPTTLPLPGETITPAAFCDPNLPPAPHGSAPGGFSSFRMPLPSTPLWNPPGLRRVGVQAGHWRTEEVPPELGRLQGGASGGGKQEWEVNLGIATEVQRLLEAQNVQVDLLPATVPVRYQANAFIAVHSDGDTTGTLTGYKIARPGFSSLPDVDDRLTQSLYDAYGAVTGLERDDDHISLAMRYYYAFNSRRYCSAVAPGVPQAIVETGFLTNAADRRLLVANPAIPARGIADGVLAFLASLP